MVHSIPIPPSGQPSLAAVRHRQAPSDEAFKKHKDTERLFGNTVRAPEAPERFPTGKPEKVVGPIPPYGSGGTDDACDPRRLRRHTVLPPQPAHRYRRPMSKPEPEGEPMDASRSYSRYRMAQSSFQGKMAQDMVLDRRPTPLYASLMVDPDSTGRMSTATAAAPSAQMDANIAQCGM